MNKKLKAALLKSLPDQHDQLGLVAASLVGIGILAELYNQRDVSGELREAVRLLVEADDHIQATAAIAKQQS